MYRAACVFGIRNTWRSAPDDTSANTLATVLSQTLHVFLSNCNEASLSDHLIWKPEESRREKANHETGNSISSREESDESEGDDSIDSIDVDSDSEETDMEDVVTTIKDCRPCKVDLPNIRVERGSSQDVEVPREVLLSLL